MPSGYNVHVNIMNAVILSWPGVVLVSGDLGSRIYLYLKYLNESKDRLVYYCTLNMLKKIIISNTK